VANEFFHRLYQELGPGPRVSLAKLSADHYISTGRRLRLAVDASIWAFQVQAGKGIPHFFPSFFHLETGGGKNKQELLI